MSQVPLDPNYNPAFYVNRSQAEQSIYLELEGDSRFPSVSVIKQEFYDKTAAFPANSATPPLTSVEIYPKFATLNYIVNAEDMSYALLAQDGFIVADNTSGQVNGTFSTIQVISACKFQGLTATSSTTSKITAYELPQNFSITGPITNFTLLYGAVIAYKNS